MEWMLILLLALLVAGAIIGPSTAAAPSDDGDSEPGPGHKSEEDFLARQRAAEFSQDDAGAPHWHHDDDH